MDIECHFSLFVSLKCLESQLGSDFRHVDMDGMRFNGSIGNSAMGFTLTQGNEVMDSNSSHGHCRVESRRTMMTRIVHVNRLLSRQFVTWQRRNRR